MFPVGAIISLASGQSIPSGWLACDGSELSTTDALYSNLYTLIGTTFGSGTGTFRLPDLRARIPSGVKASTSGTGLSGPIGSWTGALTHTLSANETGDPGHGHTVTDPGHGHTASYSSHYHQVPASYGPLEDNLAKGSRRVDYSTPFGVGLPSGYYTSSSASTNVSFNAATPTITVNSNTATGATSHSNHQPTLAVPYIIKL